MELDYPACRAVISFIRQSADSPVGSPLIPRITTYSLNRRRRLLTGSLFVGGGLGQLRSVSSTAEALFVLAVQALRRSQGGLPGAASRPGLPHLGQRADLVGV
ncbi:MAG: hypothetical protein KDA37_03120 [Planctomycetales bacterium]|nr:hypothetical protein [Planctomycetales bacterium]